MNEHLIGLVVFSIVAIGFTGLTVKWLMKGNK